MAARTHPTLRLLVHSYTCPERVDNTYMYLKFKDGANLYIPVIPHVALTGNHIVNKVQHLP